MLSSFNLSPHMTDYDYYKNGNQSCIHDLGCDLIGLFGWDNAKEEFVKLEKISKALWSIVCKIPKNLMQ